MKISNSVVLDRNLAKKIPKYFTIHYSFQTIRYQTKRCLYQSLSLRKDRQSRSSSSFGTSLFRSNATSFNDAAYLSAAYARRNAPKYFLQSQWYFQCPANGDPSNVTPWYVCWRNVASFHWTRITAVQLSYGGNGTRSKTICSSKDHFQIMWPACFLSQLGFRRYLIKTLWSGARLHTMSSTIVWVNCSMPKGLWMYSLMASLAPDQMPIDSAQANCPMSTVLQVSNKHADILESVNVRNLFEIFIFCPKIQL